jgi:hypothetical protein
MANQFYLEQLRWWLSKHHHLGIPCPLRLEHAQDLNGLVQTALWNLFATVEVFGVPFFFIAGRMGGRAKVLKHLDPAWGKCFEA